MDPIYVWLKYAHVLGAILIFGTGLGTAFHMFATHLRGDARAIAVVSKNVVVADWIFTAPAVVAQPFTGLALLHRLGVAWDAPWVLASVALYALAGACWLPVVALQIRAARLAAVAVTDGVPLPAAYHRAMRIWVLLGIPAFAAMLIVVHLMIAKPMLW